MNKKTAGIYNRWLFTLGGGEQVTFAYAEALRDAGYKTTLLTHKKFDRVLAEKKMNVQLKGISIAYLPLVDAEKLSSNSEKFDLFINTSYLDYFPSRSKNGFLSVFFPAEIYLSPWEFLKRKIFIPSLQTLFIYPTEFEGFAHDAYMGGKILKWLSSNSSIRFNSNSIHDVTISIYFPVFSFSACESISFFNDKVALLPTTKTLDHKKNIVSYTLHSDTPIQKLVIHLPAFSEAFQAAVIKLEIPSLRYVIYNLFKNLFPRWEMRLHGGPGVTSLSDIQSYKKIITISNFCKYWIKKYWGVESVVLYPPVNIASFATAKKENWICHIGRFFVTGHSKKQLELIQVFKEMIDTKQLIDWQLHLVGTVYEGKNHQQYFDACVAEAQGYPVFFHTQAPFLEVQEILSKSKMYWHATGLDADKEKQPILLEHFGITTVEAMASGCIPIVINAGGQPEIVTPGTGYVWNTREELQTYTAKVAHDPKLAKILSKAAKDRSTYFSKENFLERFKKIISV